MTQLRLLFPYHVFEVDFLEPNKPYSCTDGYFNQLKETIDAMRKKDPMGRKISNAYTGWQSNDGCERHPAFAQLMRKIKAVFDGSVLPFYGLDTGKAQMVVGNSWANVNDNGAWNKPHLHNGCWYSGVFYIKADGDEGEFVALDTMPKVVNDHPSSERTRECYDFPPTTGQLVLFPSALMHMVAPNLTDKDRYSVSFNCLVQNHTDKYHGEIQDWDENEFCFDLDERGNPIFRSSK